MFINRLLCTVFILIISTASLALAETRPYIGLLSGIPLSSVHKLSDSSASVDTDSNPGYLAGLTAGVSFDMRGDWNIERARTEIEMGYRSNELLLRLKNGTSLNGRVSVSTIMANGYVENTGTLPGNIPIIIFLTAGAGAADASISTIYYRGTVLVSPAHNTRLAYQGGIGVAYELTKNIRVDAAYKYLGTTNFNFMGIKAEYGSHNVLFGAQYMFR